MNTKTGSRAEALRRFAFALSALIVLAAQQASAATNGLSSDHSKGVVLLGSPAGAANCKAATMGAIRYNSTNPGLQYCDGTNWQAVGGMTLIATQTASGTGTMQFTSLPTAYNTLFLNCEGLIESSNTASIFYFYVGEGAGPTWETTAHYSEVQLGVDDANSPIGFGDKTSSGLFAWGGSTTIPKSIKLYIGNVGSSALYKFITYIAYEGDNATSKSISGAGYWTSDKNPVTALELAVASGTITSGTCSLYGMN